MSDARGEAERDHGAGCPELSVLKSVFDGDASTATRAHILAHLPDCAPCCDRLATFETSARSEVLADATTGTVIAQRYKLRESIGRGQWGQVWSALDQRLRRRVAVKMLRVDRLLNADDHYRAVREAEALAQLRHPNIVVVYDHGTHGGRPYLVMELIEGVPLSEFLRAQPLSLPQILRLYEAAASGLTAAHGAAIIHRDFKPENVLVDHAGVVHVTDFGLAVGVTQDDGLASQTVTSAQMESVLNLRLTPTAGSLGTPAYMAPELWRGRLATPGSDQFALCASMAEGLLGRELLTREDIASAGVASAEMIKRLRDVPSWLRPVLVRGLDPNPAGRYPSLEALMQDVRSRGRRRKLRALGIGASVVAGVVALAVNSIHEDRIRECIGESTPTSDMSHGDMGGVSAPVHAVRVALDDYSQQARGQYAEVCRASGGRPEQATAQLWARSLCLREALATQRVVAKVMLASQETVTGWHLLGRLPALSACVEPDDRATIAYLRVEETGTQRQLKLIELLATEHRQDIRADLEALARSSASFPRFAAEVEVALAAQFGNDESFDEAKAAFRRALAHGVSSSNHRATLAALFGLIRLAESDRDRAQLLLDVALPLATSLDAMPTFLDHRARFHIVTGELKLAIRDVDDALTQLQPGSEGIGGLRRRQTSLQLLRTKTTIERHLRRPDSALVTARAIVREQLALGGDDVVHAIALAQLGGYAQRADRREEAATAYQGAIQRFESLGQAQLAARARIELSRQLTHLLRWEEAIAYLQETVWPSEGTNSPRVVAQAATFLAYVHEERGEPVEHRRACDRAVSASVSHYGATHVRSLEAEAFCIDGRTATLLQVERLHQLETELSARTADLPARQQITAHGVSARVHTQLAHAAITRGDFDDAIAQARAAADSSARANEGDRGRNHVGVLLQAEALARQGHLAASHQAVQAGLEAIRQADAAGDSTDFDVAAQLVAAARALLADGNRDDEAQTLLREAAMRFDQAGLPNRAASARALHMP